MNPFGMFKPQPMMVKQMLMASGIDDPVALRMVDRLMSEGLSKPDVRQYQAPTFTLPTGAEALMISGENAEEDLCVLVVARKKAQKTLDAPA